MLLREKTKQSHLLRLVRKQGYNSINNFFHARGAHTSHEEKAWMRMKRDERKRPGQTDPWYWKGFDSRDWKLFQWLPWFFVLFFLIATGVEILDLTNFLQQQTTRVASGKILQVFQSGGGYASGPECSVTYQFVLPEKQQVKGDVYANICPYYYKAGDTVPIAYSRTNPTNVRILPPGGTFWGPVRENLISLIGGTIFSAFWTVVTRHVMRQ